MAKRFYLAILPQKGGAFRHSGRRVADRYGRVARSTHFENTPWYVSGLISRAGNPHYCGFSRKGK
jgi:hypothetical protein